MKTEALHIGMKIRHPQHGEGTVRALTEHTAEIRFDNGEVRTLSPETSDITPLEAMATVNGLNLPLAEFVRQTVETTLDGMGVEKCSASVAELGKRWQKGKMVLHPSEAGLQAKEVDIDVFFHKIVMIRNNLRILEQRINSSETLSSSEKFDWQQYVTRCYGSLTTFNLLFKDKESWF